MRLMFGGTLFLSAALSFCVQPMAAKAILPLLGGSPSVWNACVLGFQAWLLIGYAYSHVLSTRFAFNRQVLIHGAVLIASIGFLPLAIPPEPAAVSTRPTLAVLSLLAGAVGVPFLVLATTAPLVQKWFVRLGGESARDPYFLYAASNLGSLLALLGYPSVIEPNVPLSRQAVYWSAAYLGLIVCLGLVARASRRGREPEPSATSTDSVSESPRSFLSWTALAFAPSSLMLGVTTHLTTDLAPTPMLWVAPLALYLITHILAFSRRNVSPRAWATRSMPIAFAALTPALAVGYAQAFWVPLHLLTFFLAALVCHDELARRRPPTSGLTSFYLALSIGGALGGVFNALVAPMLFDRVAEYPLILVATCLALPNALTSARRSDLAVPAIVGGISAWLVRSPAIATETAVGSLAIMVASGLAFLAIWKHRSRPLRFAMTLGAVLLASGLTQGVNGRLLLRERTFFGVSRVTETEDGRFRRLFHGSTLHGQQSLEPGRSREPLAFFEKSGPIGRVFETFRALESPRSVAVVGLGAGALAAYAEPGESWTFYELDPTVIRIASDPRYFTYLKDCRANPPTIVIGDARLRIRERAKRRSEAAFDLLILDAFGSDAPPVHLLTREALALYRQVLSTRGLIAVNLSNRYLDLEPVLGALAKDAGAACRVRVDSPITREEEREGKQASIWGVLARTEADLGPIAGDARWAPPRDGGRAWTDDYSDMLRYLKAFQRIPAARTGTDAGR